MTWASVFIFKAWEFTCHILTIAGYGPEDRFEVEAEDDQSDEEYEVEDILVDSVKRSSCTL